MDPSAEMDHQYVDRFLVAERYLNNALTRQERAAFEAHLVDCQECTDRVLLAGMFHAREDGIARPAARLVLRLKPWQIAALLITALLLLAIPIVALRYFVH